MSTTQDKLTDVPTGHSPSTPINTAKGNVVVEVEAAIPLSERSESKSKKGYTGK
jgi:hypothetical protein